MCTDVSLKPSTRTLATTRMARVSCSLQVEFLTSAEKMQNELASFSFSSWYPIFKKNTFKSEIVPLSERAISYLREDGIHLPPGLDPHVRASADARFHPYDDDEPNDCPETEWSSSDEDDIMESWVAELKATVDAAIRKLGGNVFPKMNWSSPKDACWMLPNRNLKCSSLADILLLFKSSTFMSYDLSYRVQQQGKVPLDLILREWSEINPGWEFRCFVKDHSLVGISQRSTTAYYRHSTDDPHSLTASMKIFFQKHIQSVFPLDNYTFDLVTFTPDPDDFRLVDFNPFSPVTDSLLFRWDELESAIDIPDDELLRVVSVPLAIQPDDMRQYEVPADFMDSRFTTNGRSLFDFLGAELTSQGAIDSDEEHVN